MPFIHWFKKKFESTETEAKRVLAEKHAAEPANAPEPLAANSRHENGLATLPNAPRSADLLSISQNRQVDSEVATSESDALPAMPHLSVPIGAFYAKLPKHLLTVKQPDLARAVQIAEEDVVLDQDNQEATLPLSTLSLSCPEIFIRPVDGSDDVPVTFSISHLEELEPSPAADVRDASVEGGGEKEIKLRLQPILTDFPPQLEPPAIHSLLGTEAEITLPLGLIQSQLAHGRVVVAAETFCKALPSELKPYFEAIDPAAEIPIPLQVIFSRISPAAIKLREDQEVDCPEETILTPFAEQADEDAKRFSEVRVEATATANEEPQPKDEPLKVAVGSDSKRLQAIFLTDEPLDLAKTIQNVAGLPGLRSCLLTTTDGLKLAGNLGDPGQERAISTSLPGLFQWTGSKLEALHAGTLETVTLYYGLLQLSTFVEGKLCLTVLHDSRPFKPGVREKIRAVMNELAALSAPEKPI